MAASVGRELQRKQKSYRKELRYKQKSLRRHAKAIATYTERARPHKYYKGSARYLGGELARSPSDLRRKERKLAELVAASVGRELQRKQKSYRKELRYKQRNFRQHAKEVASFTYKVKPRPLSNANTKYQGDELAQHRRTFRHIDKKQEKARSVSLGSVQKAYTKELAYRARQLRRYARAAVDFEGEQAVQVTMHKDKKMNTSLLLSDRRLRNEESIMVRTSGVPEDVRKKKKKLTYDKGERAIWND